MKTRWALGACVRPTGQRQRRHRTLEVTPSLPSVCEIPLMKNEFGWPTQMRKRHFTTAQDGIAGEQRRPSTGLLGALNDDFLDSIKREFSDALKRATRPPRVRQWLAERSSAA